MSFLTPLHNDSNYISKQLYCFIIPFRDRYPNLGSLIKCLKDFKVKYQIDFDLYLINQTNNQLFNRGKLFNIGYLEVGKNYDYIYFGDCDALPCTDLDRFDQDLMNLKLKPYTNFEPVKEISHLSSFLEQWNYIIESGDSKLSTIKCTPFDYLKTEHCGGSILVKNNFFSKINGFSNLYEGWGGEDNDLGYRIMTNIDENKVKSEIINFLNERFKNTNIINTYELANLENIEYSTYQFLNLILSEYPYPNIRKDLFFEKIKKHRFTYNNFDYKIPPGVYFNRRPCIFKDSKHHNQNKGSKRININNHHNPNYENNLKKISEIRNKFYNNEDLNQYFLSDGLNNCHYEKINKISYTFDDFKFDVINIDFKSENKYQKISIIIYFNNNLEWLKINLNRLESSSINTDLLEVILIKNALNKEIDVTKIIKSYSYQIKLIDSDNLSNKTIGQVLNYSLSKASGDLILIQFSEAIYNFDLGVILKSHFPNFKHIIDKVIIYQCYTYLEDLDKISGENDNLDLTNINLNSISLNNLKTLVIPSKLINLIEGFDERLDHLLDCQEDIISRLTIFNQFQLNIINDNHNLILIDSGNTILISNYQTSEIVLRLKENMIKGVKIHNWRELIKINNTKTYYNPMNYHFDYNQLIK